MSAARSALYYPTRLTTKYGRVLAHARELSEHYPQSAYRRIQVFVYRLRGPDERELDAPVGWNEATLKALRSCRRRRASYAPHLPRWNACLLSVAFTSTVRPRAL